MLRIIRVVGIVAVAFLVGLSANALHNMYESGTLFEAYNNSRKANITLFCFSLFALVALVVLEMVFGRRIKRPRRYGEIRRKKKVVAPTGEAMDIYAVPDTADEWNSRKKRAPRSRRAGAMVDITDIWLMVLRSCCCLMPFIFTFIYFGNAARGGGLDGLVMFFLAGLVLFTVVMTVGVFRKTSWGMYCGYVVASIALLFFPLGTAVGLIMLLALVGASPVFEEAMHEKKKAKRRKRKLRTSAI